MNIGIICEYNPFHYGHLYHLNKIKSMYKDANIILVITGWINQRGDLSLIDKFDKTKIALEYGVNLVVELPYKFIQSADYFAKGSIEILNKLKCDVIVFGSESNDIKKLTELAKVQIENKNYENTLKKYTKEGFNYPKALSLALKDLNFDIIDSPNDILGLCYIKEILKNNYNITPITIKRNSNYNSKIIEGKITSASSIRELLKHGKSIRKYVPKKTYEYLKNPIFIDDYFNYLKYKIISTNDLTIYQGIDLNIQNRIKKNIIYADNFEELLKLIKTKRYTYNRLKRSLLNILLSLNKDEFNNLDLEYIRVLGFDKIGLSHLNKIKKDIDIPLLTNYNKKYLSKDLNINTIISLNNKIKNKNDFIEKEYKQKPIIKR